MKRTLLAAVAVTVLGGGVAYAATMTTTAARLTAFSQPTTVPTIPATPTTVSLYLQGGTGVDTGGSLVTAAPSSGSTPHSFEIARDRQGRDPNSTQTSNDKRRWFFGTGTALTFNGPAFVDLHATMKAPADFAKGGRIWVFLKECSNTNANSLVNNSVCTPFAYGTVGRKPWGTSASPVLDEIQLLDWSTGSTTINRSIPSNRHLLLFITVGADSPGEDGMRVHWNSTAHPSRVRYTPGA